jgi:hypothetical protein
MIVRHWWRVWTKGQDDGRDRRRVPGDDLVLSKEFYLHVERVRLEFCNVARMQRGEMQSKYAMAFDGIRRLQALLRERNIGMVVAMYPDEFQVNDALFDEIVAHDGLDRGDYDRYLIQKLVGAYAGSLGIPVIDMLEGFRRAGRERELYLLRNTHWNPAGDALAADLLFEQLKPLADAGLGLQPVGMKL